MNNLDDVEYMARHLMHEHGFGRLDFGFDNSKEHIGCTHGRFYILHDGTRVQRASGIALSRHYALKLSMDELRETVLHEIAHAMTMGDGHGPLWQAKAIELGIPPRPYKFRITT